MRGLIVLPARAGQGAGLRPQFAVRVYRGRVRAATVGDEVASRLLAGAPHGHAKGASLNASTSMCRWSRPRGQSTLDRHGTIHIYTGP
jgi:hypothetical protein